MVRPPLPGDLTARLLTSVGGDRVDEMEMLAPAFRTTAQGE